MAPEIDRVIHRCARATETRNIEMSTTDVVRQMEADDLARAKTMTEMILQDWDLMTWNELLADDVVLSLKLGAVGFDRVGDLGGVGGNLQVSGREDAKRVLKRIYRDLKNAVSVTTEVVSGYDVALLGNMVVRATKDQDEDDIRSLPIALYMAFNPEGRIQKLTIAAVDLGPLTKAIRSAAQTGALQSS
jgi:hypothetical protein